MSANLLPFFAILPASIYSLLTLWCGWLFFKDQGILKKQHDTAISILKPVKGMDEGSYENFASFCRQDYAAPLQLIFCVAAADDPAIEVIKQLMADFPQLDIYLNIDPTIHGPNYKVSNLINAFPQAKYDLLMICDSDIRVEATFLQSVTTHFSLPETGLVTSPYRSSSVHGTVTAFEALAFTSEMIPNVVTALKLEGLSFALGAAMTFRRQALMDIGGLEALGLMMDKFSLSGGVWRWVGVLNDHLGDAGFVVVGLFVACWVLSVLNYRWRGYDNLAR